MIAQNYLEDQKKEHDPSGPDSLSMDECSEFAVDLVTNSDTVLHNGDFRRWPQTACSAPYPPAMVKTRWILSWPVVWKLQTLLSQCTFLSDHLLLTLQVVVSCPFDDHQASGVFVSTLQLLQPADRLLPSVAPLFNFTGGVDHYTDDFNKALPAAIKFSAPLVVKQRTTKRSARWFDKDPRTLKQSSSKLGC